MDRATPFEDRFSLEPVSFSSGIPDRYEVLGLPHGQTAEIVLQMVRGVETWKIRIGGTGRFRGGYKSADAALSVLQAGKFVPTKGSDELIR